jgi:hypothetical protein
MESLKQLEQNLVQLLNQYQELQLQVKSLQEENQRQRDEIIQTHADMQQLKHDYNNLHTAHTLLLGNQADDDDRIKTKQRLTNMILLIDKTLEILKQ